MRGAGCGTLLQRQRCFAAVPWRRGGARCTPLALPPRAAASARAPRRRSLARLCVRRALVPARVLPPVQRAAGAALLLRATELALHGVHNDAHAVPLFAVMPLAASW
jgi:hypothetical protein